MSDEQIKQKTEVAVEEWWKNCRPPRLLNEQHNVSEIFEAAYNEAIRLGGNIDVGDVQRVVISLGDIDLGGKLIYHKTTTQVAPTTTATDAPWLDEPRLRYIVSVSAVAQLTPEQMSAFCSVTAMHEYDSHGRKVISLNQKFNERFGWLQNHRDVNLTEAINRVLGNDGPKQPQVVVRGRQVDPRETVIRERILKESRGSKTFFTPYAKTKFDKLNKILDELLADSERRVFYDRSRGGVEILRGWAAIEKIMDEKIRGYEGFH